MGECWWLVAARGLTTLDRHLDLHLDKQENNILNIEREHSANWFNYLTSPGAQCEVLCSKSMTEGSLSLSASFCRLLNCILSCNIMYKLLKCFSYLSGGVCGHTGTFRTCFSCCLSRSVCMWIFASLASWLASTRWASCSARSPSSYFSAASWQKYGLVKYVYFSTRRSLSVWAYLAKGLHLLAFCLDPQGWGAYSVPFTVQFLSLFFKILSLFSQIHLLLFQICSTKL